MSWKRILVDIVLLLGIFWLPWWIVFLAGIVCLFIFKSFYEVIILGLLIDSLYNAPVAQFYHFHFVITIVALIFFIISVIVKNKLRFYSEQ